MSEYTWGEAVAVGVGSKTQLVANAMDAADIIFTAWPDGRGPAYDKVMQVFAAVFDGRAETGIARWAFIDAVEESPTLRLLN